MTPVNVACFFFFNGVGAASPLGAWRASPVRLDPAWGFHYDASRTGRKTEKFFAGARSGCRFFRFWSCVFFLALRLTAHR